MNNQLYKRLKSICQLLRFDILTSTTTANSGHPSSCLSAVELMATLFFGGHLHHDLKNPNNIFNDRIIFSKGHAAPLLYSLYHVAGAISYKELLTLRTFNSRLEGHPTLNFPFVDVATGSLGQGLSIGVGMAMGIKLRITNDELRIKREPKVWVLLGDSELSEGQNWEAMQTASYYKLNNLIGILDVSRLGQTGQTMLGWDLKIYQKRIESFGWKTIVVEDGNDLEQVDDAFKRLTIDNRGSKIVVEDRKSKIDKNLSSILNPQPLSSTINHLSSKPTMIIAKTIKGKGVSFMENKNGWHGKVVPKERLQEALDEIGGVDLKLRGYIKSPQSQISKIKDQRSNQIQNSKLKKILNKLDPKMLHVTCYKLRDSYSTREAFGDALLDLGKTNEKIVVFDAEMANSTFENKFQKTFPDRFIETFIEEQNMISAALGISKIGYIPFVSTFAAFLTRAYDQIRMAQYSNANIKIIGSHVGVFIGADGPSQMGLEDVSMMRSILNSVVLSPSDAVSTYALTKKMPETQGIVYMRTLRKETPVIYDKDEKFEIGGSKVHQVHKVYKVHKMKAIIIASGITVHEALKAQQQLAKEGISVIVLDCYCIKPIDQTTINQLTQNCSNIIVVEDHYPTGGLGEAILSALADNKFRINLISNYSKQAPIGNFLGQLDQLGIRNFTHLCVRKTPRSGKPEELLRYEEIDSDAIVKAVKTM